MEPAVIFCLCLLFPAGAAFTYIRSKKRRNAGRRVLEAGAHGPRERIALDCPFSITAYRAWCRVRAVFVWKNPAGHVDDRFHRYRLSIEDTGGRQLYAEERSMTEFFGCCWYGGLKSPAPGAARCMCDAVLLEFVPPAPEQYRLKLELQAVEGASELLDFQLMVSERVWPLKGKPYAHACVDFRKKRTTQGALT